MIGWSITLLNQVSKLKHVRNLSSTCHGRKICELKTRAVVRVQGSESKDFLQGLMTNDMEHLEYQPSLYSMFLNTQGRIMFDTFVVKRSATEYLIDCDHHLAENLVKHLKMFKVRRKIDITLQEDEKVWAIVGDDPVNENDLLKSSLCYYDNRCKALGLRAIGEYLEMKDYENCNTDDYQVLRYRQGIPEGSLEIPPGKCTPLEYNIEYMHGVSFHKGCYIGQELTARTHHTGVIRKRIMPLTLSSKTLLVMEQNKGAEVLNEKGKKVGVVRGQCKNTAIGLVRLDEVMNDAKLNINGELAKINIPEWWPKAAPKSPKNR